MLYRFNPCHPHPQRKIGPIKKMSSQRGHIITTKIKKTSLYYIKSIRKLIINSGRYLLFYFYALLTPLNKIFPITLKK